MKDEDQINTVFSSIAVDNYKFEVQVKERVIVYELLCEVIGLDYSSGLVLVYNPHWGEKWVAECNCIRISKLFNLGLLRDVIKTVTSPKFLTMFKDRIGAKGTLDLEHDSKSSGYIEYEKSQTKKLTKTDK